ncbi:MAG TPA: hypothetical protein VGM84_11255 [Steroidobacteraceae bacterium]|jgi:hypothetical protein
MTVARRLPALAVGFLTLVLTYTCAWADVTTEQTVTVNGVGIMAVANFSGTTKVAISGHRSRTDSDIQMKSKFVRFLTRNSVGPSAEIVLLDTDTLYHLNLNKKEFSEQTFKDLRARRDKVAKAAKDSKDSDEQDDRGDRQPSAIDQSKCEWLPPKADVKRTGEKATVAGYEAERVVVTAEQPCKDKETGSVCEIALTLDEWLAPSLTLPDEVQRYRKAYLQKLGLDPATLARSPSGLASDEVDANERAKALFSRYQGVWSQVTSKMQGLKGYPVRFGFGLAIGGDQCKQAQDAQASTNNGTSDSGDSGSVKDKAVAKLGSLFRRKKENSAAAPSDASVATPPPAGTVTLVTLSSELKALSTDTIPADAFEVPVGFKKIEPAGRAKD